VNGFFFFIFLFFFSIAAQQRRVFPLRRGAGLFPASGLSFPFFYCAEFQLRAQPQIRRNLGVIWGRFREIHL